MSIIRAHLDEPIDRAEATLIEFVALIDWGRGRRNVNLLLLGLGAEKDADDASGEK